MKAFDIRLLIFCASLLVALVDTAMADQGLSGSRPTGLFALMRLPIELMLLYIKVLEAFTLACLETFVSRLHARGKHPLKWAPYREFGLRFFKYLINRSTVQQRRLISAAVTMSADVLVLPFIRITRKRVRAFSSPTTPRGVWLELRQPIQGSPKASVIFYHIHGGAFTSGYGGMGAYGWHHLLKELQNLGIDAKLFSLDYPLSPEHPFPSALLSAVGGYEWLQKNYGDKAAIIPVGESGGGNLVLSMLMKLRDQRKAGGSSGALSHKPRAAVLVSPWTDLSLKSQVYSDAPTLSVSAPEFVPGSMAGGDAKKTMQVDEIIHKAVDGGAEAVTKAVDTVDQVAHRVADNLESVMHKVEERVEPCPDPLWETDAPKGKASAYDIIDGKFLYTQALKYVVGDVAKLNDPFVSPSLAQDFSDLVDKEILIMAGGLELLLPDIKALHSKLNAHGAWAQLHIEPGCIHNYLLLPTQAKKQATMIYFVESMVAK